MTLCYTTDGKIHHIPRQFASTIGCIRYINRRLWPWQHHYKESDVLYRRFRVT